MIIASLGVSFFFSFLFWKKGRFEFETKKEKILFLIFFTFPVLIWGAKVAFYTRAVWISRKEEREFQRAFPLFMDNLKFYLQAGLQLPQALHEILRNWQWPASLSVVMRRVLELHERGYALKDALNLENFPLTLNLRPEVILLLKNLELSLQASGNVISLLEKFKQNIQMKMAIVQKVNVLTAQMRFQSLLICISPLFIALIVWFLNPAYILFFIRSDVGRLLLFFMVILNGVGMRVLHKMIKDFCL